MEYHDLRDFIDQLERDGDLKRIKTRIDPNLEITEISHRVLLAGGPALLFEQAGDSKIPLLANLFGTERRVARAMGEEQVTAPHAPRVQRGTADHRIGAGGGNRVDTGVLQERRQPRFLD